MKSLKWEAIIIAIGLLLLGNQVRNGISEFIAKDRIVTVKGLAEMEVPADKVVWPLMFKALS